MYRLYYSPGTATFPVHWMLLELGAPHELVTTDITKGAQKSAEYLKLNPTGRVPTLVVDGRLFWGLDALPMLAAYLAGDAWFEGPQWDAAAALPVGIRRPD